MPPPSRNISATRQECAADHGFAHPLRHGPARIGLAIGEPPATKGYPPSVFAKLPQLVERAGNGSEGGGSITAFYTVLTEGDDQQDPIADSARAILDGHIVLSRRLAEQGHYPAIDIEASISRAMNHLVSAPHTGLVQRFKHLYAHYQRNHDLISVGAYVHGSDPLLDEAILLYPQMEHFLKQGMFEAEPMVAAWQNFPPCSALVNWPAAHRMKRSLFIRGNHHDQTLHIATLLHLAQQKKRCRNPQAGAAQPAAPIGAGETEYAATVSQGLSGQVQEAVRNGMDHNELRNSRILSTAWTRPLPSSAQSLNRHNARYKPDAVN